MSRLRILITLHFVALFTLYITPPVRAQMVGGTIAGTILDPSSAPVQDAKVVIRNEETGTERNLTTRADGAFSAPAIAVGVYSVSAEKNGFAALKRTGISVAVGKNVQ